jgi:D-alanine-D-alanine ligase
MSSFKKVIIKNLMKKKIALISGGYSGEYVISINSGKIVGSNIDSSLYEVFPIIIDKKSWTYTDILGKKYKVNRNDFSLKIKTEKIKFDCILNIIHGTPGEDGKLQGYFDMLQIPYTGCDSITSALTFNKRFTVAAVAFSGLKTAPSIHLIKGLDYDVIEIAKMFEYPVFVKPNNGGSSLGMTKVLETKDLAKAITKAFKEDTQVLVEEMIHGEEFTVGVFRDSKGKINALPVAQIIPKNDFFDYESKYIKGMANEIIPAPIEDIKRDLLQKESIKIYEILNCKGIVRIDFIWNIKDDAPYMLEVNTVPGQSAASIVPQMVNAYGWTLQQFYTELIEAAML